MVQKVGRPFDLWKSGTCDDSLASFWAGAVMIRGVGRVGLPLLCRVSGPARSRDPGRNVLVGWQSQPSSRLAMIVAQQPAESLAAGDLAFTVAHVVVCGDQLIVEPLVISLFMIVLHVLSDGMAK